MNINLMLNKELIRSNSDKFDIDESLWERYHIIFGRIASVFSFDISSMKKNDAEIFSAVEDYCNGNGYRILQKYEIKNASDDENKDVNTCVLYVNPQKEVMLFFNGAQFIFAYNAQFPAHRDEIERFFKCLSSDKLQKQEKKKSLYFLSSSKGSYSLRELDFPEQKNYDVEKYYNDDFKEIADRIESFLETDKSGLVILNGKQGTGKTSFIRHLINVSDKRFIYIPADVFPGLLSGLENSYDMMKNCLKDSVIIIEDCDKLLEDRKNNYGNISRGMSGILNLSDGLLGDVLHTKIICIFNNPLAQIDKSLLRKGRLVEKYEFTNLSAEKSRALVEELYPDAQENIQEMTLAEIFNIGTDNHGEHVPGKPKVGFKK